MIQSSEDMIRGRPPSSMYSPITMHNPFPCPLELKIATGYCFPGGTFAPISVLLSIFVFTLD